MILKGSYASKFLSTWPHFGSGRKTGNVFIAVFIFIAIGLCK